MGGFNDRKNIVHGVYMGFYGRFGEINGKETSHIGLKVAYVANRKFEIGVSAKVYHYQQNIKGLSSSDNVALVGSHLGIFVEPILFSVYKLNLSFPLLVGAGVVTIFDGDFNENDAQFDFDDPNNSDFTLVVEPGISLLYNISRIVQLEATARYTFSNKFDISSIRLSNINGFSAGFRDKSRSF